MKTPIDFGKDFLYKLFDQRDADACQKMLAGDLVWITPENMHHFLSEGAVLKYLRRQIKAQKESMYVDLISIKSSPSADNIMTVAYEINLVSSEGERPLYLRCSMVICRRSRRLEITFLHFSKKSERDSSEQLRAFIANLPCGVMILACLDGRREEAIFYNEYFANRLHYKQDEFARAMAQNPFFMASEEDRERIHEEIAGARKNGGSITANLRFYRRDGNSFYYRMKGAPAYQADGGTVYYCVFQETTGFQMTTDRLQSRLDTATEILRQIPEALCGIEYPPQSPPQIKTGQIKAGSEGMVNPAPAEERTENLPEDMGKTIPVPAGQAKTAFSAEDERDVRIYRSKGSAPEAQTGAAPAQGAAKITKAGPRVFFTSKNIPSMFGVSNSVYMKNILLDPFYGLEITSITRDRLMSSLILNPDKTATAKAVSCGIFRIRRPDQADDKSIRVELMVRRVRDKDGTLRLYLFYFDREAAQQAMESRVDKAMKMGRAGKEQLRIDLRKAKETAARRQSELTAAMKEAEKKYEENLARVENSLAEEKKRSVLMSRQLEESRTAQRQIAEERERIEEDASRRIRNHEARAQRQVREACTARDLLEEQLREAQERSRELEQQLQKEKSRRLLLEEQYRQLQEQNEELLREDKDNLFAVPVKITDSPGPAVIAGAGLHAGMSAQAAGPAPAAPVLHPGVSAGVPGAVKSSVPVRPAEGKKSSPTAKTSEPGKTAENIQSASAAVSRRGDWMTQTQPLTVFSSMDGSSSMDRSSSIDSDSVFGEKEPDFSLEQKDDRTGMSSEKAVLKQETFSPEKLLRDIMIHEENANADKQINLRLLIDNRLPASVIGFASLLESALCEIIENAISRVGPGGIISVYCRSDRPSGGLVNLYFRIDDNGSEIPAGRIRPVFADGQTPDEAGRVGTGFYAAEEAAALMGGSLNVSSSSGKTRFSLTTAVRVQQTSGKGKM